MRSPVRDAADFAAVLADPEIGNFAVSQLIDQREWQIRRGIAAFLHGRDSEETVLIYVSCHGIQDERGKLFFAATDTDTRLPYATAIRASDLLVQLDDCLARRQILILDCCFSGAFSENNRGPRGELDLERQLRGHSQGREVLTASRAFEYSFEGEPLGDTITGSVFTTGLVEGVRTGAADTDKDGHVSVEEAYLYAFRYVQAEGTPQTPQRWPSRGEGSGIVLARSPAGRVVEPARLPEDLRDNLESRFPDVRIGAVRSIAAWLTDPDAARRVTAVRELEEVVRSDLPRVAEVARECLDRARPPVFVPLPQPAPDDRWVPQSVVALLEGNAAAVYRVAFSPDGARLASGGGDWSVRLWETATGKPVRLLRRHSDVVRGVAYSPDGKLLASCGDAGAVLLWNPATGAKPQNLKGHGSSVRSVAFSPGGAVIASGAGDKTVRLWDAETGWKPRVLKGHLGWVRGVAFSPDGATVASCGNDKTVRLWDVQTGNLVSVLDGHTSEVHAVAFSRDGKLLASGGADGVVRVWDPRAEEQLTVLQGHAGVVYDVAFSPHGDLLASASEDKSIRLWR